MKLHISCHHDTRGGRYLIDNNRAGNSIRLFAVGRKNWLFSSGQAVAGASANPYTYLRQILTELPKATWVEGIEVLLPWSITLPDEGAESRGWIAAYKIPG